MSASALYSIGTLVFWVGLSLLIFAASAAIRYWLERSIPHLASRNRAQFIKACACGLGFTGLGLILAKAPEGGGSAFRLPLSWIIMPFWAWLAVICGFLVLGRLVQAIMALNSTEAKSKLIAATAPLTIGAASLAILKLWGKPHFEIVQGSIPLTTGMALLLAGLAFLAVLAMAATSRNLQAAKLTKSLASHAALLIGSLIFGIPFAFLVITSFKEDRDMSSANGIIWVPKVQRTVPYLSEKNPVFEAKWQGKIVQGSIIEELPDGTVRIDIARPMSVRGLTFVTERTQIKQVPVDAPLVETKMGDVAGSGKIIESFEDGRVTVEFMEPATLVGKTTTVSLTQVVPIRDIGLRTANYSEALSYLPPETMLGLVYLKNTLILVALNVLGTILSSALAAYAFSRMRFPGRDAIFAVLLSTLMLPAAVTLLPQFLIFKQLGWVDTLLPLWVPSFFGAAFNIFLLRQFFLGIPIELEDAAKVDGCTYLRTFWSVLLPQIKPALAVIAVWTFVGSWNNFMGPLIYINSPENMPISYALQVFQSDRAGEPGMLTAFATLSVIPVLLLFFFAQKYFIEGVALTGLGGR